MKKSVLIPWVSPEKAVTSSTISSPSMKEAHLSHDLKERHISSRLIACTTITEFKDNIANIVKRLGLTDYCFTVLNTLPAKSLTTLPQELHDVCLQDCYCLMQVISNETPVYLSDLESFAVKTPRALPQRRLRNAAGERLFSHHGYHEGYCIPLDIGEQHRKAMFTLFAKGASREEFRHRVERYKPILSMLLGAIAYFGCTRFSDHFAAVELPPLSPAAALASTGSGRVRAENAASKWRSSLEAANRHLAAAKHALEATPLTNMVYLAMVQGFKQSENPEGL